MLRKLWDWVRGWTVRKIPTYFQRVPVYGEWHATGKFMLSSRNGKLWKEAP